MFLEEQSFRTWRKDFLGKEEAAGFVFDGYLESNLVVQTILPILLHVFNINPVVRAAQRKYYG